MGIDYETTGKDQQTALPIEVGYSIWDEDSGVEVVRDAMLIKGPDYPKLSEEVIEVTGITDAMLCDARVMHPANALLHLTTIILKHNVDTFLAHNKAYDETIFKKEFERNGESVLYNAKEKILNIPWRCTLIEIDYPAKYRCKQLSHLLLDHGETVNPSKLHRALGDVKAMKRLMETGGYTIRQMEEYANTPWVYFYAVIPKPWEDGGKGKDACKEAGYGWEQARGDWDGPSFPKKWVKRMKQPKFEIYKEEPFPYTRRMLLV